MSSIPSTPTGFLFAHAKAPDDTESPVKPGDSATLATRANPSEPPQITRTEPAENCGAIVGAVRYRYVPGSGFVVFASPAWLKPDMEIQAQVASMAQLAGGADDAACLYNLDERMHFAGRWVTVERLDLPRIAGLYAIYRNGQLIYIGESTNLRVRFAGHNTFGPGDTIKIRVNREDDDHLVREVPLIRRLRPSCNKRSKRDVSIGYTALNRKPLRRGGRGRA